MFNRLHGIKYIKKEHSQQIPQQYNNLQKQHMEQSKQIQPIQQNVLPIIVPPDLPNYTANNYKYELPKPIEYIAPEIIPKEQPYEKPVYEKPVYGKPNYGKPVKKNENNDQGKRFASFNKKKEAEKGKVFDELAKKSLKKYKINLNNIFDIDNKDDDGKDASNNNEKLIKNKIKHDIITIKNSSKKISKKPRKKRSKKELVFDDKKYLDELNNIKMSLARLKSIQKKFKKKSNYKTSIKPSQFKEPEKIIKEIDKEIDKEIEKIEKIEKNDENYKVKFDELKDAYIKKHNILIDIFNGYQKLYKKS